MRLIFSEIVSSTIAIDEDTFEDYLDDCEENSIIPTKDDFMDWFFNNYYVSDFVIEYDSDVEYSLTEKQFNEYLKNFNNND